MSNYQAIVFDIDGTAMPNLRTAMPSARMVDTINRHKENIHLFAATGRPLAQAQPIIEALGLTLPCAISGGTTLYDPLSHEIISRVVLPPEAIQAIIDVVAGRYRIFLEEKLIGPQVDAVHAPLLQDTEIVYVDHVPLGEVPALAREFDAIPGITASPVLDWSGDGAYAFNITHRDATKEHAVATLLQQLGVPREAAIGIGDGDNDLHLFRSVGLKIAMGNASPNLIAAADLIAPTVSEDGLAQIIDRYAAALSAGLN